MRENDITSEQPFDFGLRLQDARRERGFTQRQAAYYLKINRTTVSAYERGIKMPRVEILRSMAVLYRVSLDKLMGLENQKTLSIGNLSPRQQLFVIRLVELLRESTILRD